MSRGELYVMIIFHCTGSATRRARGHHRAPEDAAAREDAAALAEEIAELADSKGNKGERGAGQLQALHVLALVALVVVVIFAPNPWGGQHADRGNAREPAPRQQLPVMAAQSAAQQQLDQTVADCTRRLTECQRALSGCRETGSCADAVVDACSRLMHACAAVSGGGPVGSLPPRPRLQQQAQDPPRLAAPRLQQQHIPQRQPEGDRPRMQPVAYPDTPSEGSPLRGDLDTPRWAEPASDTFRARPVSAAGVLPQAAGGGACQEAGKLTGRGCVCPSLSPGPVCPAGQASAGSCACPDSQTTPFEHKDHVKKLVKRELPQSFAGPVVLARDSPSLKGTIKVHLPGKEPAWKRIGKVSEKEADKWLPAADPVREERQGVSKLYESCAVVGSSGVLLLEDKGAEIDSHEFVMRFNGAPTKGLERFVGSKTTVRIVNHSWQDFREKPEEIVLSHLRGPHHLEDFKLRRQAKGPKENWFLFSPEFSNYAAQTAYEVATFFGINLQAEGTQAWTPTGGWTGILMAMNICAKVDIYGFHISERHGVPYHYHNRCPQPFMHRDVAEWLMVRSFKEHSLIEFRDACVFECHGSDEECTACKAKHPVPRSVYEAGKALWKQGPMPDYCADRLTWLKKEEAAGRCTGLCGKFEKQTDWGSS
eukprot:jgi/Tetstr1/459595/TSEL_004958.t1